MLSLKALGLFRVEGGVSIVLIVQMAVGNHILEQINAKGGLLYVGAPVLLQRLPGLAEAVRRNVGSHVVRHMHVDVVSEELDPGRVFAVHGHGQSSLHVTPLRFRKEGNVWQGVVDHREGAHPKVEANVRHQPESNQVPQAVIVQHVGEEDGCANVHSSQRDHHFAVLVGLELAQKEVFFDPYRLIGDFYGLTCVQERRSTTSVL
jgi:hypothetical protein